MGAVGAVVFVGVGVAGNISFTIIWNAQSTGVGVGVSVAVGVGVIVAISDVGVGVGVMVDNIGLTII